MKYDKNNVGPLNDIRVLDLSRLVAGNMLSVYLADFGADVIKIERANTGDDLREWKEKGIDVYWKIYGRNKRSLALDLRSIEGMDVVLKLVKTSDVFIENFVPGTLEKMGLAPETLLEINPKLIIVRISGWGQTGPYKEKPGFGTLIEAMSGFAALNGFADKPPSLPPLALADMIAGVYGAAGVLTALHQVNRSKKGQVIDLSLFEPIFSVISSEAAKIQLTGIPTERTGNQASHAAPRNIYMCSDGKYVALSGSMQSMAMKIFDTIGKPELKRDERFIDNNARVKNREQLDAIIGRFMMQHTRDQALEIFEQAAVTVGPVCTVADLIDHPYTMGRQTIVHLPDEDMNTIPMHNIVPRLVGTPGGFRRPAPKVGEHNEEILRELGHYPANKS
ncbi:CaiB/BaiF CoA transferase family protein [Pseudomonas sp. MWU13-2105]|uniref:CaiB/BaiF CoA transferase family protein n=1 Tax=Pseudomonas sp. MWU13-2105 TaxID=2935074 RepID=UPI00200DB960|nr:CoA transferase [Pseudomonas sp. MWU13-2105]